MTEQMKQPQPAQQPAPQPEPQTPQPEPQTPQPEPQTPQPANAYESIIEQQQQQITALMEQTKMLNEQIVNLVNNGGQLNQFQQYSHTGNPVQSAPAQSANVANNPAILPTSLEQNEDYSLESLAKDIGKKPKKGQ